MKLQFDDKQEHQLIAVNAVVNVFKGQPKGGENLSVKDEAGGLAFGEKGVANRLTLSAETLLENVRHVQKESGLPLTIEMGDSTPHFTIEMETGTGKTYVYLRTIYELNKHYGFKKFVIVVPSIAIREGVLKNLEITHDHFQALFSHEPCHYMVYDSKKTSALRNFALSNAIEILVINIDAFAKDSEQADADAKTKKSANKINQRNETGIKPIEFIQDTHPIVIIDEPQNMETDKRKAAIARLHPLCTLRYSATPKYHYHLLYRLDPVTAFELGLVKQIGVDSVVSQNNVNQAYIELLGFRAGTGAHGKIKAQVKIWMNDPVQGAVKKSVWLENGDDLYKFSGGRDTYNNQFFVNDIDASNEYIEFANDVRVYKGQPQGELNDDIQKVQIAQTVRRHFEKERKYAALGIKVLSVFFIDRVANYRSYDEAGNSTPGKFAQWFEEAFNAELIKQPNVIRHAASEVHNGYFSQDKQGRLKDSTERNSVDDVDTYGLIMREKERLLDPNVPLRFIFSHSALREGWDNPNVFQICTLNESVSDLKKRQEIGRGLRLCVNQHGVRIFDRDVNRLTMIVNESYDDFAKNLQKEFEVDGIIFKSDMVKNERERVTVRLRKGYEADARFIDLWQRIKAKTRYNVQFDTVALIQNSIAAIRSVDPVQIPKIVVTHTTQEISLQAGIESTVKGIRTLDGTKQQLTLPDVIANIQAKVELSASTILAIVRGSGKLDEILINPQEFIDNAAREINIIKRELMVAGIEYAQIAGDYYEMRHFELNKEFERYLSDLQPLVNNQKTIYEYDDQLNPSVQKACVVLDSNSTPERDFAKACDENDDVLFYLKLPDWFKIDTPVGPYNPDWALMYQNDDLLYFVAETKDNIAANNLNLLRPIERLKIESGRKHFSAYEKVAFKVVGELSSLIA